MKASLLSISRRPITIVATLACVDVVLVPEEPQAANAAATMRNRLAFMATSGRALMYGR